MALPPRDCFEGSGIQMRARSKMVVMDGLRGA